MTVFSAILSHVGLAPRLMGGAQPQVLTARAAQRTPPYFELQRAQMMLLAADGWHNAAIATRVQTRRGIVWL